MKPPETMTLPLPCPYCKPSPVVEIPVTFSCEGTTINGYFDQRALILAVRAHAKQHLS